jgi:hypothetical protein
MSVEHPGGLVSCRRYTDPEFRRETRAKDANQMWKREKINESRMTATFAFWATGY